MTRARLRKILSSIINGDGLNISNQSSILLIIHDLKSMVSEDSPEVQRALSDNYISCASQIASHDRVNLLKKLGTSDEPDLGNQFKELIYLDSHPTKIFVHTLDVKQPVTFKDVRAVAKTVSKELSSPRF